MSARYSWLQQFESQRPDGTILRPNPYDNNFAAKPMRQAVLDAINAAPVRPPATRI